MSAVAERTIEVPHEQLLREQSGFTQIPNVHVTAQSGGDFRVKISHMSEYEKPDIVVYQHTFSMGPVTIDGVPTNFEFQISEPVREHRVEKILGYTLHTYVCV